MTIIRLLACDLDGTLMGNDTIISVRARRALTAAQARGIFVTLATGRGYPATLPFARQLNIDIPLICYQGGIIKHPLTGHVLHQATMARELVLQVNELARGREWHLVIYIGDDIYVQELSYPRDFYLEMLGPNLHLVDDLRQTLLAADRDPAKFILVADKTQSDQIQAEMSARFDREVVIVRSHDLFVEGNPLGVSKGDALRRLSEQLGVSQAQVMAIGDQGNDVSMLAWAGLGVAMASGSEETLVAADWIAPSLADDGAALAIERFLLRNEDGQTDED